ncbi:PLP-dependent aminotransferase family protein [Herbaspirillum sp. alder98]|uniref:aminotransferase-like domain-containing protein n=1 Tax=Herbaspirillum sp. alder98 TaxID=2913096 RepID=UPI001CD90283|nr:PLP-dependent aminotransferase family protein [Herbaspirillum sp. alder98]MCA1325623.1 PLP-dependent aminotransferase family protein [Herbaspirillum sp. alder98]
MALIQLSTASKISLVEQIVDRIKNLVDSGSLRSGTKMTSIRLFARQHLVSVHTVADAFERLVALGYLESRPRSGFFVKQSRPTVDKRNPTEKFAKAFDHLWQMRSHLSNDDGLLDVSTGKLPKEWMDPDMVKASLKSVASKIDSGMMQYGEPYGYLPLRTLLLSKLSDLGIYAQPDQVLLTQGASQAMDLIIRYLLRPGDKVLVDDPGYFNLFSNLQMQGIEPLPVRRNHDGPDLDMLEKIAQQHRPSVMFTQSVLQTPTGSTISPGNAYRLLRLSEQYDFRLVENDAYADMLSEQVPRLATLDQLSRVFYVGSFSKTLSVSARVGYVAAPANSIKDLANMKMITSITSAQLSEKFVFHALTEGLYRRSTERLKLRLASSLTDTENALRPLGFQFFCRPLGGKFIWIRHPKFDSSSDIWKLAANAGIIIAPGKVFRNGMQDTPWFRLNVCYGTEPALIELFKSIC